jgi:uncharacterized protein (TIGR02266 family)
VQRFAPNVTRGGIFLATRAPRPVGDVFAFEVQLSTGQLALAGDGKVIWVKEFDPSAPQRPHGMGVQFIHIDPTTRGTLNRILQSKSNVRRGGSGGVDSGHHGARNGTGPVAMVDTSVDLAAEYGIDEATLRRAVDHRWMVNNPTDNELDELLKPEPTETVTLAQALAELPRLLDPSSARRRSGAYRSLEITNTQADRVAPATEKSRPAVEDDPTNHSPGDPLHE